MVIRSGPAIALSWGLRITFKIPEGPNSTGRDFAGHVHSTQRIGRVATVPQPSASAAGKSSGSAGRVVGQRPSGESEIELGTWWTLTAHAGFDHLRVPYRLWILKFHRSVILPSEYQVQYLTCNKKLLGAPGIATNGAIGRYERGLLAVLLGASSY